MKRLPSLSIAATLAVALAALAGCTADPATNRQMACAGTIFGGAAVGGLLGNQIGNGGGQQLATAAGAGIGAGLGTQTGYCQ